MKTVQQHLEDGISTLEDLRDALQIAMQLEFATIPPYLCAQWSVKADPDKVEALIHEIVAEEMSHLALAGNVLRSIGGTPRLANSAFIPEYPIHLLPGGIPQTLPISLLPLCITQLEVFMQIEHPEFPPFDREAARQAPTSIGAFYREIIHGLARVSPHIDPVAHAVPVQHFNRINNLEDAIETFRRVAQEGEGTSLSPDQPPEDADRETFAHYYLFKEIYLQRRLIHTETGWQFGGCPITLPEVYDFEASEHYPEMKGRFSHSLTLLLLELERCWIAGKPPNLALMFELSILGKELVRHGVTPPFIWNPT